MVFKKIPTPFERMKQENALSIRNDNIQTIEDALKIDPNTSTKDLSQKTGLNCKNIVKIVHDWERKIICERNYTLEESIKFYLPRKIIGFNSKTGELRFETSVIAHYCNVPIKYVSDIAKKENSKILLESEEKIRNYLIERAENLNYLKIPEETVKKISLDLQLYPLLVDYIIYKKELFHDVQLIRSIVSKTRLDSKRVAQIYFALRNPNYFINGEANTLKINREMKFTLDEIGKVKNCVVPYRISFILHFTDL